MNPWWKRPSSESSSTASRSEAERRSKSKSQSKGGNDERGGSRGGRRGGGGSSKSSSNRGRNNSDQKSRGNSRGGRGRGGRNQSSQRGGRSSSRGRGGSKATSSRRNQSSGRSNGNHLYAVLVDVEALHKHLKACGSKPEEAASLFDKVGKGVALRAVACGKRKQKVQRALRSLDFDIEQVDGGVEDARLRLALDAMELAIAHRGASIFILTHQGDGAVLENRLRHHGAELTYFSKDEPPVIADVSHQDDSDDDDDDDGSDDADNSSDDSSDGQQRGRSRRRGRSRGGRRNNAQDSPDDDSGDDGDDSGDDDDSSNQGRSRRRRRRAGRRGRPSDDESQNGGQDDEQDDSNDSDTDSRPARGSKPAAASSVDPLKLLSAAIGKLVAGESQLVWATKVRQEMSSIAPMFNEADHGYDDFEALLREAERRGRIALQKDPRTSTFVIVGWRAA